MIPDLLISPSLRLPDQWRERLRYKHYSLRTEPAYLHGVRFFVRWRGRDGQLRHPRATHGSTTASAASPEFRRPPPRR